LYLSSSPARGDNESEPVAKTDETTTTRGTNTSAATEEKQEEKKEDSACAPAPEGATDIAEGLTIQGGGALEKAYGVKLKEPVGNIRWVVAARLTGSGMGPVLPKLSPGAR
jgi:hypothetical protein